MFLRFALRLAVLALFAGQVCAAELSAADKSALADAQSYLNARQTLSARFIQTSDDGSTVTGTLLLKRPGRMNLSYDPPMKDFIIADGSFVYLWDGELEQVSTLPLGGSLADLILREKVSFDGDIKPLGVTRDANMIEITVTESKKPDEGSMTLLFEETPFLLRGWRVTDAQARTTTIALQDMREGVAIPDRTFHFLPPRLGKNKATEK